MQKKERCTFARTAERSDLTLSQTDDGSKCAMKERENFFHVAFSLPFFFLAFPRGEKYISCHERPTELLLGLAGVSSFDRVAQLREQEARKEGRWKKLDRDECAEIESSPPGVIHEVIIIKAKGVLLRRERERGERRD